MRIKKYSFFIFIAAAILFSSCKKDDLQSQSGTPVFYAKGSLNGNLFSISGGVNNYYMYSSYSSDALDIYQYTGTLKEQNCSSSCPSSMSIRVRDYRAHTAQATSIDSALTAGFYNFVLPVSASATVAFTPQIYADSTMSYSWDFGDFQTSTQPNPVHTYTTTGIKEVCLSVTTMLHNSACSSSICDSINVGAPNPVISNFTATPSGGDSIYFVGSASGGVTPYSYYWRFSNNGGNPASINCYHSFPVHGVYTAEFYVIDGNNVQWPLKKNILAPTTDSCTANFTWQDLGYLAPDLSKVIIEWTDASGNVFTSANPLQPASSSFQIVSVENYDANENQQPTKKVHMLVNCTLYHGSSTMLLQNADIVFALAYP